MNWLVIAFALFIAFQAGQFIGFFRGWKFGLLHPPKTMIYFTPMFSVRLREWGLQVRLTSRKVFRIGTVTESKDSRWETSQTEVYYPNRGSDGYPFGWLEALSDSAQVFPDKESQLPLTVKLAEVVGLVKYGSTVGRKSKAEGIETQLRLVRGWMESGLSSDDYGNLKNISGSTLERYKKNLRDLKLI